VASQARQRATNAAQAVLLCPASKAIGGRRVVGERAQRRLQPLQRLLAADPHARGEHGGEDFKRVTELLALDPQPMQFSIILQPPVGPVEEPAHERLESPHGVARERLVSAVTCHPVEEPLQSPGPVRGDEPIVQLADRLS
jgi:hypothetical protein